MDREGNTNFKPAQFYVVDGFIRGNSLTLPTRINQPVTRSAYRVPFYVPFFILYEFEYVCSRKYSNARRFFLPIYHFETNYRDYIDGLCNNIVYKST